MDSHNKLQSLFDAQEFFFEEERSVQEKHEAEMQEQSYAVLQMEHQGQAFERDLTSINPLEPTPTHIHETPSLQFHQAGWFKGLKKIGYAERLRIEKERLAKQGRIMSKEDMDAYMDKWSQQESLEEASWATYFYKSNKFKVL